MPNEMPAICHTGSNCDYHFIIKALANKFKGKFKCLAENTGKYNMLFVLIEKEITKIYKDGNQNIVTIYYKKIIDSTRFMATSLSNIVDNLREGIHKIKCKDCGCLPKYKSVQDNLIK